MKQRKLNDYEENTEYIEYVNEVISNHNDYAKEQYATFWFRNHALAHLWISEWIGQISDGKYENAGKSWKYWNKMPVAIDGEETHIVQEGKRPVPDESLRFTDLVDGSGRHGIRLFKDGNILADCESEPFRVRCYMSRNYTEEEIVEMTREIQRAIRDARKR